MRWVSCNPSLRAVVDAIAPVVRRQQVLALRVEPCDPGALRRAGQLRPRLPGKREIELEVTRSRRIFLARRAELFQSIVANRLEESVTLAFCFELHQRFLDQPGQQVENARFVDPVARTQRPRRPRASNRRRTRRAVAAMRARARAGGRSSSRSTRAASAAAALPYDRRVSAGGKRSARRSAIFSTGRVRTRAAASSSASGMPSRRRQISETAGAFCSVRRNAGCAATARSTKRRTASYCVSAVSVIFASRAGTASDGTWKITSPATCRCSRLDASTLTFGPACSKRDRELLRTRRPGARNCRGSPAASDREDA